MFWILFLILHGLMAFLLLGAITHQAVSAVRPGRDRQRFVESFAAVCSMAYTNAVVVFYVLTFLMGGWIYINYRLDAKLAMEQLHMMTPIGMFELKEHFLALAFGLLPTYWLFWKKFSLSEQARGRIGVTLVVAFASWWGFLVGHVLNNIRGIV